MSGDHAPCRTQTHARVQKCRRCVISTSRGVICSRLRLDESRAELPVWERVFAAAEMKKNDLVMSLRPGSCEILEGPDRGFSRVCLAPARKNTRRISFASCRPCPGYRASSRSHVRWQPARLDAPSADRRPSRPRNRRGTGLALGTGQGVARNGRGRPVARDRRRVLPGLSRRLRMHARGLPYADVHAPAHGLGPAQE